MKYRLMLFLGLLLGETASLLSVGEDEDSFQSFVTSVYRTDEFPDSYEDCNKVFPTFKTCFWATKKEIKAIHDEELAKPKSEIDFYALSQKPEVKILCSPIMDDGYEIMDFGISQACLSLNQGKIIIVTWHQDSPANPEVQKTFPKKFFIYDIEKKAFIVNNVLFDELFPGPNLSLSPYCAFTGMTISNDGAKVILLSYLEDIWDYVEASVNNCIIADRGTSSCFFTQSLDWCYDTLPYFNEMTGDIAVVSNQGWIDYDSPSLEPPCISYFLKCDVGGKRKLSSSKQSIKKAKLG